MKRWRVINVTKEHLSKDASYSLLTIIINRGKGSKVLNYAKELGAKEASCFLGKGTIRSKVLHMLGMDEVEKEIILVIIPSSKEDDIIFKLNKKFNFEKTNFGIAFIMPLVGISNFIKDTKIIWNENISEYDSYNYTSLFVVVDKGKGMDVVEISQKAGYYGGTIIKAHGSAGKLNIVLDMIVEPEKELVLMLMESKDADHLASILNKQLNLDKPNTGMLVKVGVSKTIGLFNNRN